MKNTLKKLMPFALTGVISGATVFGASHYFTKENNGEDFEYFTKASKNSAFVGMGSAVGDDFVKASKMTVPAVVTIKNYQDRSAQRMPDQDMFDFFFGNPFGGNQQRQQQPPKNMPSGLGSGVIISPDGYIISNNHVVAGANKLEVVLSNKKSYIATLVGTDPNTDISLLKI